MPSANKKNEGLVNIPVRYEFRPQPMTWRIAEAEVIGWHEILLKAEEDRRAVEAAALTQIPVPTIRWQSSKPAKPPLHNIANVLRKLIRVRVPAEGLVFEMLHENFPKKLLPRNANQENTPVLYADRFPILLGAITNEPANGWRDPWELRDEFVELAPDSLVELEAFMNRWGAWGIGATPIHSGDAEGISSAKQVALAPETAWELRDKIRAALPNAKDDWLLNAPSLFKQAETEAHSPWYVVTQKFCEGALNQTVTIDKLKEVEHFICQRPGCRRIFAPKNKHGKKFCDERCGGRFRQAKYAGKKKTPSAEPQTLNLVH